MSLLTKEGSFYDIPEKRPGLAAQLRTEAIQDIPIKLRPFAASVLDRDPHHLYGRDFDGLPHFLADSIISGYQLLNPKFQWDFKAARTVHPDGQPGLVSILLIYGITTGERPILSEGRLWSRRHRLNIQAAMRPDEVTDYSTLAGEPNRTSPNLATLRDQVLGPFLPLPDFRRSVVPFGERRIQAAPVQFRHTATNEVIADVLDLVMIRLELTELGPYAKNILSLQTIAHQERTDLLKRDRKAYFGLIGKINSALAPSKQRLAAERFAAEAAQVEDFTARIKGFLDQKAQAEEKYAQAHPVTVALNQMSLPKRLTAAALTPDQQLRTL